MEKTQRLSSISFFKREAVAMIAIFNSLSLSPARPASASRWLILGGAEDDDHHARQHPQEDESEEELVEPASKAVVVLLDHPWDVVEDLDAEDPEQLQELDRAFGSGHLLHRDLLQHPRRWSNRTITATGSKSQPLLAFVLKEVLSSVVVIFYTHKKRLRQVVMTTSRSCSKAKPH
ncbi:hypothetical protein B296_00019559 [Ensete ventricosum]|uniref:Uncharacterized protein n=1 Tax=Ensete ventricosum TaxID=4639 RepID=A0A427B006_ENSVE|nr:hypothetical protein B296_00019559 [Ensete ventricosum]